MHWKDLRAIGEKEQRLYSLDAWRECPYYTERERAALAWTEAVTRITDGHVSDAVYAEVRSSFSEKELADPTSPKPSRLSKIYH
jgi:alkylhydroperoxidase family enzyme